VKARLLVVTADSILSNRILSVVICAHCLGL